MERLISKGTGSANKMLYYHGVEKAHLTLPSKVFWYFKFSQELILQYGIQKIPAIFVSATTANSEPVVRHPKSNNIIPIYQVREYLELFALSVYFRNLLSLLQIFLQPSQTDWHMLRKAAGAGQFLTMEEKVLRAGRSLHDKPVKSVT